MTDYSMWQPVTKNKTGKQPVSQQAAREMTNDWNCMTEATSAGTSKGASHVTTNVLADES